VNGNDAILTETIAQTLAIDSETRRPTSNEKEAALRELRCYLPVLIKQRLPNGAA